MVFEGARGEVNSPSYLTECLARNDRIGGGKGSQPK